MSNSKIACCGFPSVVVITDVCTLIDPGAPSQPKTVSAVSSLDDTIKLTVEAPSECDCGQITDYAVRDFNHDRLTSSYSLANGNVTITVAGLEAGRQYAVQVSAINNRSWEGPSSVPVAISTSCENVTISDVVDLTVFGSYI